MPRSNIQLAPIDFKALPKIDLHRHLEGSIRPETFLEIARTRHLDLPTYDLAEVRKQIQITDDEPDFLNFLSKFAPFRLFWPDREAIEQVAYETVEDAARDNVVYLELRYSPTHFARGRGFDARDVVEWVTGAARHAAEDYGIRVEFIMCAGRHYSLEINLPGLEVALEAGLERFVGVDVAGDEINFPLEPFAPYFPRFKDAGLGLTLHAGEAGGPENVREVIEDFGADRVGHGVRIVEDETVVELAREREVAFEMCLTSNLQTATVKSLAEHPAKSLLDRGLRITLNTDDPSISQIDLSHELSVAISEAGFEARDVPSLLENAVRASFLPERERTMLRGCLGLGPPGTKEGSP